MKPQHLAIMMFVYISGEIYGQTSGCMNADFEFNNFDCWVGKTGDCCPVGMSQAGIVAGRHTIMSNTGTDPLSLSLIPLVPPDGGKHTARLGNSNIGAEAEQLLYSFQVTEASALFVYRYAVVLEDPGHPASEQPRFSIRVFDQAGDSVSCGTYNVVASGSIPGFINNGDVRIKPWTTVGIQLTDYIGETITIEFTTADCGYGGHFGYAYLECYSSPFTISSELCPGGNNVTVMNAPPGFANYLWSDGSSASSITVVNPETETTYICTLTSVTGCMLTLEKTLVPINFHAAFTAAPVFSNEVTLNDSSYVVAGPAINHWYWNFGDGTTSSQQNNVHTYSAGGVYNVQLIVENEPGCKDTVIKNISTQYACFFPNSFSPNDDGKNDFFTGTMAGQKEYEISIFDRFGQMIFNANKASAMWNGTYKNHRAAEGVYIYKVNITDIFNKSHLLAGTVNLIR